MRSLSNWPAPLRILAFAAMLALIWVPLYGLAITLIPDPNTASIVAMVLLFAEFVGLNRWWNQVVHDCDRPWQRYGLQRSAANGRSLAQGWLIGGCSLLAVFITQALLGWVTWRADDTSSLLRIALDGGLVALGIAFGEELIFRGWFLDELERDYGAAIGLWGSSILFAVLHFIRPLSEIIRTFPQFPGLVLLGLALVWAKRSHQGRLGIAMGVHGGLVWGYYVINVGNMIRYEETIPAWWTGIDRNPLAGVIGLGFLAILALGFRHRAIVANRV